MVADVINSQSELTILKLVITRGTIFYDKSRILLRMIVFESRLVMKCLFIVRGTITSIEKFLQQNTQIFNNHHSFLVPRGVLAVRRGVLAVRRGVLAVRIGVHAVRRVVLAVRRGVLAAPQVGSHCMTRRTTVQFVCPNYNFDQ